MAVLYTLPTWVTARRLGAAAGWPTVLLTALTLGMGSQAIIGLLWSRMAGGFAPYEPLAYITCWIAASALFRRPRAGGFGGTPPGAGEGLRLALTLVLALLVRTMHPLAYAALGQSDAYSHLNNLRDLLELGHLSNPVYPLGYSWILALPAQMLNIDPYVICRFAGALFGAMLVLALYVLVRRHGGSAAALGVALLAAAFPGFNLLIKTGIGVFPNQFGILLIPVILFLALESARAGFHIRHPASLMTLFCLGALTATVPMLLFHLFWVLFAAGILGLISPGAARPPRRNLLVLLLVPAALLVLLLVLHFSTASSGLMVNTLGNITVGSEAAREIGRASPLLAVAADYVTPKRIGLGSPLLNTAGLMLGGLFLISAAVGAAGNNAFLRLLGCWGLVGVLHVVFGVFQFTAYQREGWSLLEATACLGGLAAGVLWKFSGSWKHIRTAAWGLAAVIAAWSLLSPPGHPLLNSPAEEDIARLVLSLEQEGFGRIADRAKGEEGIPCPSNICSQNPEEWVVVARRFNQMGIVRALVGRRPSYVHREVHRETNLRSVFLTGKCYLVLLDREEGGSIETSGALSSVSPALIESFVRGRQRYLALNKKIESYIDHLGGKGLALVREIRISDSLRALAVYENCDGPRTPER
jgi:hypothetical protein